MFLNRAEHIVRKPAAIFRSAKQALTTSIEAIGPGCAGQAACGRLPRQHDSLRTAALARNMDETSSMLPRRASTGPRKFNLLLQKNNLRKRHDAAALCSDRAEIWRFISLN